jgi:hypothetical protein
MEYRRSVSEEFEAPGGSRFSVRGLSGQFCRECGDGFLTPKAEKKLSAAMKAHNEAEKVRAVDVASVAEAAKALEVTPQAVHKAMIEGRLRAVYCGGLLLPVRAGIAEAKQQRDAKRPAAPTKAVS